MRIVSGRFGGRRLVAPRDSATRPTSDKVREALFSILGGVAGARVLDLYAGTGALALEALSRGASHATLVESRRLALDALRANVAALGVAGVTTLVTRPVERCAESVAAGAPYDLVLADPPYAAVDGVDFAEQLAALLAPIVAPGGSLVLEHATRTDPPSVRGFASGDTRRYGDTSLTFYEKD